jgi:lactoylglutathione lyase
MTLSPLHHVVLTVSDFDRSLAFYRDVLGFRKTMEAPVEGYENYLHLPEGATGRMAMLAADERTMGMIEIIEWNVPGGVGRTPPKRPGDPGPCMIALEVADDTLESITDRLTDAGHTIFSPITPVSLQGYPPFSTMLIEDPDGLLVELIELPTPEQVRAFRAEYKEKLAAAGGDSR